MTKNDRQKLACGYLKKECMNLPEYQKVGYRRKKNHNKKAISIVGEKKKENNIWKNLQKKRKLPILQKIRS